jgi:hypothetical protein
MVANKKYSVGGTMGKSHKAGELLMNNKDNADSESILEDEFLSQTSSLSESEQSVREE